MMQRDRDSEDPEKGPAYVRREYPKRASLLRPKSSSIPSTPLMSAQRPLQKWCWPGKETGQESWGQALERAGQASSLLRGCCECLVKMVSKMPVDNCCTPCANEFISHLQIWRLRSGLARYYHCVASIRRYCLCGKAWWHFPSQHMVLRAFLL